VAKKKFHGNGKLLLFGEYAVLDGAKSLSIPTSRGQSMEIKPHRGSDLVWECYDENGELWFEAQISLYDFSAIRTSDDTIAKHIQKILKGTVRYNTEFLNNWNGYKVINRLEFPKNWGLGSSSTLIHNLASWAEINPLHLHFFTSNGSGYDVACADAENPLVYQIDGDEINYTEVDFNPKGLDQVYFVYLGHKQNSEEGIIQYAKKVKKRKTVAKNISALTEEALKCSSITSLRKIMEEHERIISAELKVPPVKEERFKDFNGSIKSLGAWGGDFVMAVSDMSPTEVTAYFKSAGHDVVIPYEEMIYSIPSDALVSS
jgi:mevalonate kinase